MLTCSLTALSPFSSIFSVVFECIFVVVLTSAKQFEACSTDFFSRYFQVIIHEVLVANVHSICVLIQNAFNLLSLSAA